MKASNGPEFKPLTQGGQVVQFPLRVKDVCARLLYTYIHTLFYLQFIYTFSLLVNKATLLRIR